MSISNTRLVYVTAMSSESLRCLEFAVALSTYIRSLWLLSCTGAIIQVGLIAVIIIGIIGIISLLHGTRIISPIATGRIIVVVVAVAVVAVIAFIAVIIIVTSSPSILRGTSVKRNITQLLLL